MLAVAPFFMRGYDRVLRAIYRRIFDALRPFEGVLGEVFKKNLVGEKSTTRQIFKIFLSYPPRFNRRQLPYIKYPEL
jgi:hypothetical protein